MKATQMPRIFFIVCITSLLFFAFSSLGLAKNEDPIQISADKMTAQDNSQSVVFTGNVDAKQGGVRIRADEMTIYYLEAKKSGKDQSKKKKAGSKTSQQVKEIFCKGHVEVTNEDWLGTGNTMHYFSKKQLVKLLGNAKAYKGQNMVEGEQINYHLDTGESEVFSPTTTTTAEQKDKKKKGRVNMTIMEQ